MISTSTWILAPVQNPSDTQAFKRSRLNSGSAEIIDLRLCARNEARMEMTSHTPMPSKQQDLVRQIEYAQESNTCMNHHTLPARTHHFVDSAKMFVSVR